MHVLTYAAHMQDSLETACILIPLKRPDIGCKNDILVIIKTRPEAKQRRKELRKLYKSWESTMKKI